MNRVYSVIIFILVAQFAIGQDQLHIYPTHWWTGMKIHSLQLMIHAKDIAKGKKSVAVKYPGITVKKISKLASDNYLFVDLEIASIARPGKFNISVSGAGTPVKTIAYELKARNAQDGKTRVQGVTSRDLIYLIMPDRFSNADAGNDVVAGYRDTQSDRNNPYLRHGGDLKGVENHLDYIKELGVTTIWMTPVVENDMPLMQEGVRMMAGYHGYWLTNHYEVDKRFGGNQAYHELVDASHHKGLKIIQDAVYNHVGSFHWFVLDPPSKDWLNQWPAYTGPNHREESVFDQNGSAFDKKNMLGGWFVPHLPDLNLANPYLATYMIQQAIWSTEEFGIDGWRVDTYKYCDEAFMNNVNNALLKEFPNITVFGEAWSNTVVGSAYFTQNNYTGIFKHNLQGVTDFPMTFAMQAGMTQPFGWTEGVNRIYMTLAQDFVYKDPSRNCLFLDNHDMDRIYSVVGEDWKKLRMGINWLFTLKGIPQLYYGTEILMKNFKNPTDAEVRKDFPGGWAGDSVNKFAAAGRSGAEQEAFTYISRLAHFRQQSSAISGGRLMQYVPRDGFYVYFRYDSRQTVLVAANTGSSAQKMDGERYRERTTGFSRMRNVVTGEEQSIASFSLGPGESVVMELLK